MITPPLPSSSVSVPASLSIFIHPATSLIFFLLFFTVLVFSLSLAFPFYFLSPPSPPLPLPPLLLLFLSPLLLLLLSFILWIKILFKYKCININQELS